MKKIFAIYFLLIISLSSLLVLHSSWMKSPEVAYSYSVNPKSLAVSMYWKDDNGKIIQTFEKLKSYTQSKKQTLLFAMNGGMYQKDYSPVGLYIENYKKLHALNTQTGTGNFYLLPNGVFYLTNDRSAHICTSSNFKYDSSIQFATQSGPMLVANGEIHNAFDPNSKNLNIRNGVGILPNGNILFAISKKEINFYDFAKFFLQKGCSNALYLDGTISRMYLPEEKIEQMDGRFGVLIGVTAKN
jgi:uncharacterized protein YigE (DUF2233 family)